MSGDVDELEIKLYLANLPAMQTRLDSLGARLQQSRVHETNLRFDTSNRDLTQAHQVLRLRRDSAARLTYKGPSTEVGGARARKEIEFTVGDFDAARGLLEALGYEITIAIPEYTAICPKTGLPDFAATATQACSLFRSNFPGTPCPRYSTPSP